MLAPSWLLPCRLVALLDRQRILYCHLRGNSSRCSSSPPSLLRAVESLHVSYLGALADLKTVQVIDNTPDLLGVPTPLLIDATGNVQEDATNYTFVGEDFPVIAWRQVFGSAAIKLDLVAADAKITTNLRKRGKIVDLFSWWWPGIFKPAGTFSKVKTVGPLFEYDYLPRNDEIDNPYYETAVPGVFANGTTIPVGQYKTLLRVLKVGGNPAKEEDYEAWLSPVVGVVAA